MEDSMDQPVRSNTPLECQRDAFSLPPEVRYLNCAFMSPLPKAVEEAGIRGMLRKRNPTLMKPVHFFQESEEVRERFADLVNAPDPSSVAILPSVSYGIGIVARNTPLASGQNIVLLHEQFPGNVYGWRRVAGEFGAEIRMVGPGEGESRGRVWNERILEAIDVNTAAVALAPVHWTDGTAFDLEAIGARAREVGAVFVVDGTQSIGALPFDIQRLQPDAVIVAGYKWLLGPYSIGVGYFGSRYLDGLPLEETWIAREGSQDFKSLVDYQDAYQPGAVRFDVGERSNFILVPMLIEALRLLQEWDPERIQGYTKGLTSGLLQEAEALGYKVEAEAFRVGHLFGIRMPPGLNIEVVREALERERVSTSLRGSALRVAPHVYNHREDLDALGRALRSAVGG
jgi:selenocysteine lyase/cysteine desulfurase